ncbi:t-SNARE [Neoconidiobolus thromboides FSU 785]|nr:t-SNARE [Neoconidiobolus thromboides FSU 785]
MSRDRLAEARAAAQNNSHDLEMTNIYQTSLGSPGENDSYLSDISKIKADIEDFKSMIAKISTLNEQALNVISDQQQQEHTNTTDKLTSEARTLMQTIKTSLQHLINIKLSDPSQDSIRKAQYATLKKQFMDSITSYQKVEQKHRQQVKARMERQYRIVRPDATEEEIKEALEGDNNGSVFAQSVLQSARGGEAKRALKEVQDRHMDIQKIVKSIEELNSLYHEMQYMVEKQEVLVENIETHVEQANENLGEVNVQLNQATELAKSSRKKKFILLGIAIIVLIIIIVVIVTQLIPSKKN